jgi:hypothetical protein
MIEQFAYISGEFGASPPGIRESSPGAHAHAWHGPCFEEALSGAPLCVPASGFCLPIEIRVTGP